MRCPFSAHQMQFRTYTTARTTFLDEISNSHQTCWFFFLLEQDDKMKPSQYFTHLFRPSSSYTNRGLSLVSSNAYECVSVMFCLQTKTKEPKGKSYTVVSFPIYIHPTSIIIIIIIIVILITTSIKILQVRLLRGNKLGASSEVT